LAGRIPDRTVRDVVEQTDMIAVVGEVVELRRAGTSWKGLCPFHNEKSPSFHVNPGLKLYHCYGCGAGGDLIRFVRETRGLSFVEAVEHLAERTGVRIEREHLTLEQQQKLDAERSVRGRMLDLARCAQAFFRERFDRPEGREAHDYAAARGLGPEITERFGLGAAGTGWTDLAHHLQKHGFQDGEIVAIGLGVQRDGGGLYDRFRNRLMYPIPNAAGDIVGFGGRHLGEDKDVAKYMNSPETTLAGEDEASRFYHFYKKGQVVFGLFQAREAIRRTKMAIVVEGNIDVMTLHQAGIASAVAPMGTALTEQQAREIKRFTDRVALVFDGDSAGRKAAMKAVPVCLAAGLEGVYVMLPDGEDPDTYVRRLGQAAFEDLLKSAPHMLNGYIDALVAESDGSLTARAQVLQKAGPLLASIHDPIARDMARDYLAARLLERGELSENRKTIERYLSQMPQPVRMRQPEDDAPADPTYGEPEADELEQHFAAVLIWYPGLLTVAERAGGIDHLRHDGLRLALRDLCGHGRTTELDSQAVAAWAHQQVDGRARRHILRWLMEPPVVLADRAAAWLDQTLARLHERWLKDRASQLSAEIRKPRQAFDRVRQLMTEKVRVDDEIQRLQKDIYAATRTVAR
jgi:DNA primase